MCKLSRDNNHVGIKKMSINGQIITNVDYGIGYSIVWENQPYSKSTANNQRYGAFIEDIICRCIEQADCLNKTKNADKKFDEVKAKLLQAIAILQSNCD